MMNESVLILLHHIGEPTESLVQLAQLAQSNGVRIHAEAGTELIPALRQAGIDIERYEHRTSTAIKMLLNVQREQVA